MVTLTVNTPVRTNERCLAALGHQRHVLPATRAYGRDMRGERGLERREAIGFGLATGTSANGLTVLLGLAPDVITNGLPPRTAMRVALENKESSERERRALILIKRAEAEALQPRSRGRNDLSWITKIVASIQRLIRSSREAVPCR